MPGESHCSPREIQTYLNRVSGRYWTELTSTLKCRR